MKLRMSWIVIIFITAISLSVSLGNSSLFAEGNEAILRAARAATSAEEMLSPEMRRDQIFEMSKNFDNGERSAESIQRELEAITGDTPPIRWNDKKIKNQYKLTHILSHVHNLDNNFELLFSHTLPHPKQQESTFTHYTNRINEADEKNTSSSLVFSKFIKKEHGRPTFDQATRAQYFFSLKSNHYNGSFNLRQPEGVFDVVEANENSFDPLAILNAENGNFDEIGEYAYEIQLAQTLYLVSVTPRITSKEKLILEVDIREINSLTTTTFILVYEQQ